MRPLPCLSLTLLSALAIGHGHANQHVTVEMPQQQPPLEKALDPVPPVHSQAWQATMTARPQIMEHAITIQNSSDPAYRNSSVHDENLRLRPRHKTTMMKVNDDEDNDDEGEHEDTYLKGEFGL